MRYLMMAAMAAAPALALAQQVAMAPPRVTTPHPQVRAMPTDPLQKMAYQAVVLKMWPKAPQWKLAVYQQILDSGKTVQGLAKRTTYCPQCSGRRCADGSPVRRGICAASRNVSMGAIVWLETEGLLKVCDRGGAVRIPGGGENAHFDVWVPDCPGGCWTGPGTKRRVSWATISTR
jgi:hypothetical protein